VNTTQAQRSLGFVGAKILNKIPLKIKKMQFTKSKFELKNQLLMSYA